MEHAYYVQIKREPPP
jgi:hypothetical protein